ncbi:hypothetical protein [Paracoccus albus]|uniref:hypothetical protein n=1 Tax=Paracoccus albus TaxID=3017784 RepID=UPI0022F0C923|nr:hypothetical protein [Paracoccus albus]WBU61251.1 hypothetical protein PAF20_04915 [Paracoccus albus]
MSDFKIIKGIDVTPSILSSSVPITETQWTSGTYGVGAERYVLPSYDLYRSAIASNTDAPVAGAAKDPQTWVKIGKVNRWKMFSESIGEKTVSDDPVTISIDVPPTTNSIAFFGVTGVDIIRVKTFTGSTETGEFILALTNSTAIDNYYDWFFAPFEEAEETVNFDLPGYGTDRIEITIDSDQTIAIGSLVLGEQFVIGRTLINVRTGIEDFSLKERDEWGGFVITERGFSKTMDLPILVDSSRIWAVTRALANVRAKSTVFVGSEAHPETITLGFYKSFEVLRQTTEHAEMNIEVEGIDQR